MILSPVNSNATPLITTIATLATPSRSISFVCDFFEEQSSVKRVPDVSPNYHQLFGSFVTEQNLQRITHLSIYLLTKDLFSGITGKFDDFKV